MYGKIDRCYRQYTMAADEPHCLVTTGDTNQVNADSRGSEHRQLYAMSCLIVRSSDDERLTVVASLKIVVLHFVMHDSSVAVGIHCWPSITP